jgi:hypothetical protein
MGRLSEQVSAVCHEPILGCVVVVETKGTGYFSGRHIESDPVWPRGLGGGSRQTAMIESWDRE